MDIAVRLFRLIVVGARGDYEPPAISFNSQPKAYSRGATTLTSTPTADY